MQKFLIGLGLVVMASALAYHGAALEFAVRGDGTTEAGVMARAFWGFLAGCVLVGTGGYLTARRG